MTILWLLYAIILVLTFHEPRHYNLRTEDELNKLLLTKVETEGLLSYDATSYGSLIGLEEEAMRRTYLQPQGGHYGDDYNDYHGGVSGQQQQQEEEEKEEESKMKGLSSSFDQRERSKLLDSTRDNNHTRPTTSNR